VAAQLKILRGTTGIFASIKGMDKMKIVEKYG
jgi:hypothetical protein